MQSEKREIVGSFAVVAPGSEIKQIVISQDLVPLYSAQTSHCKYLHLDSLEGLEVKTTDDPDIFVLPDGSRLRRIKGENGRV